MSSRSTTDHADGKRSVKKLYHGGQEGGAHTWTTEGRVEGQEQQTDHTGKTGGAVAAQQTMEGRKGYSSRTTEKWRAEVMG